MDVRVSQRHHPPAIHPFRADRNQLAAHRVGKADAQGLPARQRDRRVRPGPEDWLEERLPARRGREPQLGDWQLLGVESDADEDGRPRGARPIPATSSQRRDGEGQQQPVFAG